MGDLNVDNRSIFQGDNLAFLRGINSESIDLIATDPPFNKSKDFHSTPDSLVGRAGGASFQDRWRWTDDTQDSHEDFLNTIQSAGYDEVYNAINAGKSIYGDDMGAYLCWLGIRLVEMKVLKPTGSIFLHIDHTAHAYVKMLMDAIFGKGNFRNEIVWCYGGRGMAKRWFQRKHDTILFYSKTSSYFFNTVGATRPVAPEHVGRYDKVDDEGRKYARIKNRDGSYSNIYLKDVVMQDWWNIPYARGNEATGYPTQKPLALYERIIESSTKEGDTVLDPFCGCATTPVAAERLGRQWVGIDIWKGAVEEVKRRLNDNRQLLADIPPAVRHETEPPKRTDGLEPLTFRLQVPTTRRTKHPRPRTQHQNLLLDIGAFCQGCGRNYGDDPEVLEVDHMNPRSSGGTDAYDNLTLLCPPCNKIKKDQLTLGGLQDRNRRPQDGKDPRLASEREANIRHGKSQPTRRRATSSM